MAAKLSSVSKPVSAGSDDPSSGQADLLGQRLVRLSGAIEQIAELDAAAAAGLRLPEYRVLIALLDKGALGVAGLQQAMQIDKAWISRTLGSLADKSLVESEADQHDGRRTSYRLTREGRRVAALLMRRARKREDRIFDGFDPKRRQILFDLLNRIQANVDSLSG